MHTPTELLCQIHAQVSELTNPLLDPQKLDEANNQGFASMIYYIVSDRYDDHLLWASRNLRALFELEASVGGLRKQ